MRWKIRCIRFVTRAQHLENKRRKPLGSFPALSARLKRCPRQRRGILFVAMGQACSDHWLLNQHRPAVDNQILARTKTLFHQVEKRLRYVFGFAHSFYQQGITHCCKEIFAIGFRHTAP
jgi:hypothetical protein